MIVLIKQGNDRLLLDNVTRITEKTKPAMFSPVARKVINFWDGEDILMSGDDIDPMTTEITIMPYPERG